MASAHLKTALGDGLQDRRRSARYEIHALASFQWTDTNGKWCQASGTTRNIGRAGAFVECESPPPLAAPVEIVVTFSLRWRPGSTTRLSGAGHVRHVRFVASEDGGYGAAVAFHVDLPLSAGGPQKAEE